jgi:hypothetical protein
MMGIPHVVVVVVIIIIIIVIFVGVPAVASHFLDFH